MTEPILIASALLALGRFLARRGQRDTAVREPSPDLSTALPPVPPPPTTTLPPAVPLVVPPAVAPPPVPPPAPPSKPATQPRSSPPPSKRATGSGGSKSTTPPRSSAPPKAPSVSPPPPPPNSGAAPVAPGSIIKDRARLDRAAELARRVAEDVKAKGKVYDRQLCAEFQRTAGLVADGVYGPKTAGAVKWYTGESVPPQSGRGFDPYAPNF